VTAQRKRRGRAPAPRKPETMSASGHLGHAEVLLALAARHIDTAGDLAGTERAGMLACFASNVLQGAHALVRELRAALKKGKTR
jgi:hypothetical protein